MTCDGRPESSGKIQENAAVNVADTLQDSPYNDINRRTTDSCHDLTKLSKGVVDIFEGRVKKLC